MFLRAADRCSEILSTLVLMEGKAKSHRDVIKNRLFLRAKDEGYKTIKEREAYSESHDEYIDVDNKYQEMYASKKFFELKHKWFLEAHMNMKKKVRMEHDHMRHSGFSETSGEQKYGEKEW
jgi:hypothetical protein